MDYLFERCESSEEVRESLMSKGPGYLLYKIVDDSFDYCFPMLRKMGNKLERIEEEIFEGRSEEVVRDISNAKQEIINFRKIIRPQRAVLRDLERTKQRYLAEDLELYFDDINDASERIWDMLENYKEVVEALEDTNESVLAHRVNDILRVLTSISVIVLPLTLVASVFGMNVQVPGEGSLTAFWLVVAVMVGMLVGMLGLLPQARLALARAPAPPGTWRCPGRTPVPADTPAGEGSSNAGRSARPRRPSSPVSRGRDGVERHRHRGHGRHRQACTSHQAPGRRRREVEQVDRQLGVLPHPERAREQAVGHARVPALDVGEGHGHQSTGGDQPGSPAQCVERVVKVLQDVPERDQREMVLGQVRRRLERAGVHVESPAAGHVGRGLPHLDALRLPAGVARHLQPLARWSSRRPARGPPACTPARRSSGSFSRRPRPGHRAQLALEPAERTPASK